MTNAVEKQKKSGQAEAGPQSIMTDLFYKQTLRRMRESGENIIDGANNHPSFEGSLEQS